MGFPTPEQGDKFKTPVAHTRLIKVEFPPLGHDDTHAISVCSSLQSQYEAHGLLRTVAEQFSVNAKDLCDISLHEHSQYAAFDRPNKADVMIITPGKLVTRAI